MPSLMNRIAKRRDRRIAELTHVDATSTFDTSHRDPKRAYTLAYVDRMMAGYADMVCARLDEGYEPYLLTFMFRPIPGSAAMVAAVMEQAVQEAYRRTLTLVLKKPHTAWNREHPLIWLACPDYPVPKRGKQALRDVVVNDGRHFHIVVLVPPFTRLKRPYDALVELERERFTPAPIQRVHVSHVTRAPGTVVGYGLKQLERRRCDYDEVVVLPRPRAELPGYLDPRWLEARQKADEPSVPRDPWARHHRVPHVGGDDCPSGSPASEVGF